jgi:ATP-dependent helicase/DNAse subunit B
VPLTLVLGPANSAKAGEVLGAYSAAAHRGALLVVPTLADAEHYTRELAGGSALFGSVRTFAGLADEIARRAGYGGRRLSALQRDRVLRRVIRTMRFQAISGSARAAGFAAATRSLIAELQRSLVTPRRFAQALESWAAEDPRRAPYARDLASLYLGYARELERLGRDDAELFAWRALDALRADPERWGADPVFIYGFDDLTALEREVVETIARVAGAEVTVSLTYEPGRVALLARAEAVDALRTVADRVRELPALDEHYEPASRAALHHLERRLFESDGVPVDPGDAIRLLEAGGERAEAELVAAEVLALLRDGTPAEQIAVVSRSPGRAAATIGRVFAEYGIELAGERMIPFGHTALGRGVVALARCALLEEDQARAGDLLDYLRCPGVLERLEVADALEADVRREGLRTAAQARERLEFRLEEIESPRGAADPRVELDWHARRLLAAPHRQAARVLDAREELDARAVRVLVDALAELGELGDEPSGAELVELLEHLEVPVRAQPHPGAVLFAEPLAIRARRFRAVFVYGLQEGEFPLAGAPEPFLSDERRRELAASSGLALARAEDALARERYLFYACVSRATERLVLSYRSSDEDGNLALPSPFIADVADLLVDSWRERRRKRLLPDVVWAADEAPTPRERARRDVLARVDAGAATAAQARAADGSETAAIRALGDPALELLRHRRILSGGALEAFADCPVKWLVERQLAPATLEPEAEAIARGNFMHAALEQLLRALEDSITPATLADANRILDDVLAELPITLVDQRGGAIAPGRGAGVRAGALAAIEADLRRYLAHEAAGGCGWHPEGVELRFGFETEEGSLPPLVLGDGPDRIFLRGVVDRVDVAPDGSARAVVRDYKSGRSRPQHQVARWASDRELQVALYMLAVRELLELAPVAGLYQPLAGGDLRARGVYLEGMPLGARLFANDARSLEELDAELAGAAARAVALARRLRAGELEPSVQTCSRDGCMYPGICWSQR